MWDKESTGFQRPLWPLVGLAGTTGLGRGVLSCVGCAEAGGQGLWGQEVGGRGQRLCGATRRDQKALRLSTASPSSIRDTLCKRPSYTCVVMGDFPPFILVLTTFLMSEGLTVYTSYKIMLWAVLI